LKTCDRFKEENRYFDRKIEKTPKREKDSKKVVDKRGDR